MPKGHKRKNTGVGVDFKRAKHKVGKKLPQAQNATDTSVVSRAIALPAQSIAVDKSGAAVTHRNLTLKDLFGQCGHYSEKVRLDAINGLAELLITHPNEARRHAAIIIAAASERTADADPGCRAAQRDLFQKSLIPALGKEALQPFIPVVMGHICAAMTHLGEPIRADSLKLLEVIMHWRADLVVAGYLTQVLQHFGDALARPTRGRSLKAGSLAALISIVNGLLSFLTKALPYINQTIGGSGGNSDKVGAGDVGSTLNEKEVLGLYNSTEIVVPPSVLCWQRCTWPPAPGSIDAVAATVNIPTNSTYSRSTSVSSTTAARVVLDLLLDCWMECSPGELSSHPEAGPARAATAILQCCNLLLTAWGTSLAGPLGRGARGSGSSGNANMNTSTMSASVAILEKIAVHFPILDPAVAIDSSLRDQLVQLNVSAAQLLVRFLPEVMTASAGGGATVAGDGQGNQQQKQRQQHYELPLWVLRLLDWLQGVMAAGIALPAPEDDLVGGGGGGNAGGSAGAGTGTNEIKPGNKKKKNKKVNSTTNTPSSPAALPSNPATTTTTTTKSSKNTSVAAVPAAVYGAALAAVEEILPLLPPPRRREMLAAAWSLWTRSQIKSTTRVKTLAFFSRLLSNPAATLYTPLPPTGEPLILQEEAAAWVAAMPRYLWELGTTAPATTIAALKFLLDAARYSLDTSVNTTTSPTDSEAKGVLGGESAQQQRSPLQNVLAGLHPQLTPLFGILLPPPTSPQNNNKNLKNLQKSTQEIFRPGPLASLSESTQWLAVDVLYHLHGLPESTLNTIALLALGGGKFPKSTIIRLINMALFKASEADSSQFWGVLLVLLSGISRSGVEKADQGGEEAWIRHEAVVEAGCRVAVSAAGGVDDALAALGPALLDIYKEKSASTTASDIGVAKVLYGLLSLCSATFIEKEEEKQGDKKESLSALVAALPAVFLEYVRVCITCANEDPVLHVARPQAAATAAIKVLAAKPALLLSPTLCALSTSISSIDTHTMTPTKVATLESSLLLLLEIAGNDTVESELIKASKEAETAVKAIKAAVDSKEANAHSSAVGLRHKLHRVLALISQKLGIDL